MKFNTEIFSQFDEKWALLTAGDKENFNMMTVSWGGLGTIWNRPAVTVYVRTSRYTHIFMDSNEYFTISFYPEKYRKIIKEIGTRSGTEMDKIHKSGLTPKALDKSMTFEEAEVTFLCRKIFRQRLEKENMDADIAETNYGGDAPHDMYIGEVIEIIQ